MIATGARAIVPNIKGVDQREGDDIFLLRNYEDGLKIHDSKKAKNASACVVVGAGLIGLEMVEAFKNRSARRKVEKNDHVLPSMLDKTMAMLVLRELESNGVKVITGEK